MEFLRNPLSKQNLVNQVSTAKIMLPAGFYKSMVVDGMGIVTAVATGFLYKQFLLQAVGMWTVLVAAAFFMIASLIGALLAEHPGRRTVVVLAETAALMAFFYDSPFNTLAPLTVIVGCMMMWGDILTRRELAACMEVKFMRITRPQLKKLTTALLLAGIVLYLPFWKPETGFISRSAFESFYDWMAGSVARFYPELKTTDTVQALAESFVKLQLQQDPNYQKLSPSQQGQVLAEMVMRSTAQISSTMQTQIDLQNKVSDATYKIILNFLRDWQGKIGAQFMLAWAVAVYLILRSFGVVFYWVVSFMAFVFYQILLATNFITVFGETKVQETIRYA